MGYIYGVIRSRAGGSDEAGRELCYDTQPVEAMPLPVAMPEQTLYTLSSDCAQDTLPEHPL